MRNFIVKTCAEGFPPVTIKANKPYEAAKTARMCGMPNPVLVFTVDRNKQEKKCVAHICFLD